jgi:AAA domain
MITEADFLPADFLVAGISLDGPPPIGMVHLEFQPGVTVLYGINGAGKTAILEAISDAFMGSGSGGTYLHFNLPPEKKQLSTELMAAIEGAISASCRQQRLDAIEAHSWQVESFNPKEQDFESLIRQRFAYEIFKSHHRLNEQQSDLLNALLGELSNNVMILLGGSLPRIPRLRSSRRERQDPQWTVWLGARLNDDTPLLNRFQGLTATYVDLRLPPVALVQTASKTYVSTVETGVGDIDFSLSSTRNATWIDEAPPGR